MRNAVEGGWSVSCRWTDNGSRSTGCATPLLTRAPHWTPLARTASMTPSTFRSRCRTRDLRGDDSRHGFFQSRPPSEGSDGLMVVVAVLFPARPASPVLLSPGRSGIPWTNRVGDVLRQYIHVICPPRGQSATAASHSLPARSVDRDTRPSFSFWEMGK